MHQSVIIQSSSPYCSSPMKYFTPEDSAPSEATLYIIREIAYRYRLQQDADTAASVCMN
jgi:hypothetical protein